LAERRSPKPKVGGSIPSAPAISDVKWQLELDRLKSMANNPVQTVSTSGDKIKITLAVLVLLAGVVGFFVLSDKSAIRIAVFVAGLLLATAFMWTTEPGQRFLNFGAESIRETRKVVWPTRKEAGQITAVVFCFVLVMALYLWGIDKILEFVLYDLVLGWKK
jgi:preprotein translocase subunit SecE